MKLVFIFLSCVLVLFPGAVMAQLPGMLDPLPGLFGGADDGVYLMERARDGKLVIGGRFTTVGGQKRNRIARLLANGRLDPSFNPGAGFSANLDAIAVQRDGRILVAGAAGNTYNGVPVGRLCRLLPNGRLDLSFNPGSGPSSDVQQILVLRDGKIIIVGNFSTVATSARRRVCRLFADGSVDPGFDPGDGAAARVEAVTLGRAGSLFLVGNFTEFDGQPRNRVAKLSANGALDPVFQPPPLFTTSATSVLVRRNGQVLVGGDRLASFDPVTGSETAGFVGGLTVSNKITALAEAGNGKLWIGGSFFNYGGTDARYFARLNSTGEVDPAYDIGNRPNSRVEAMIQVADGGFLLAGRFTLFAERPARRLAGVSSNGVLRTSFGINQGADGEVAAVASHGTNGVLMGGFFNMISGRERPYLARLLPNGRLDRAFHRHGDFNNYVTVLVPLADGKVLVGGAFTSYGGVQVGCIARLLPNGRLDPTFNVGAGFSFTVRAIKVDALGRILVGGDFASYQGVPRNRLARLLPNGSLDLDFDPAAGPNEAVEAVEIRPDGRIWIGGRFTHYRGVARNYVARILTNGDLDAAFTASPGANSNVYALKADGDSVFVGGEFETYNLVARNGVAKLQSSGALDLSFDPEPMVLNGGGVEAIELQVDGKLIVGGTFESIKGLNRRNLARLNPDGSVDLSFYSGEGFDRWVGCLAIGRDGKLLVGGGFTAYDGQMVQAVARIHLVPEYRPAVYEGHAYLDMLSPSRLAGRFRLAVARDGLCSGLLDTGSERVRFRGQLDHEGGGQFEGRLRDGTLLQFIGRLRQASGDGNLEFVGLVRDFLVTNAALISAQAAHFSIRERPAVHHEGRYTVALVPAGGPVMASVPVSGSGHMLCRVARSGRVRMVGRAGDGLRFSAGTALFHNGTIPLFLSMNRGSAHISGNVSIDASSLMPVLRPVSGNVAWRRRADGVYPAGFVSVVAAEGSAYVPPDRVAPAFGTINPTSVQISIGGGHLVAAPLANVQASFAPNGRAVVIGAGLPGLSLRVNRAAGTFSGQFEPVGADGRAPIFGVISNGTWGYGSALVRIGGQTRPSWVTLQLVDP